MAVEVQRATRRVGWTGPSPSPTIQEPKAWRGPGPRRLQAPQAEPPELGGQPSSLVDRTLREVLVRTYGV